MATIVVQNTAEGLAANTTVSTANSGGVSGSAWNTINPGSGNSITSDDTHVLRGNIAYKFTQAGPVSTLGWNTSLNSAPYSDISARVYVYFEELPGHDFGVITGFSGASYSGLAWNVVLNTAGRMQLSNSSGTVLWTAPSNSTMAINTWYRIEVNVVAGTSGTIAVYAAHDTTALAGTTLSSFSSATTSAVRFGIGNSSSIPALWIDDAAVGEGGGLIGPSQAQSVSGATILAQNSAEGLAVGTIPSPANSGGASGTAWNKVDQTGASVTVDDAHVLSGSVAYKISRTTSSGYLGWSGALAGAPFSDIAVRAYFYSETLPNNNLAVALGYANAAFSGQAWAAVLTTQGEIQLSNSNGTVLWTSGQNIITPNNWYRVEVRIIAGTSGQIALYAGHSTIAIAATTVNGFTAATTSAVRIGTSNTTNIANLWLDDMAVGTGDLIGPSASGGLPIVSAGANQTVDPGDTVTLTGTATNAPSSYQWTQVSGPSVIMNGSGTSRTFAAPILPVANTLVFRFTATNASGTSTPDTVTINVAAHLNWVKKSNILQPFNLSPEWPKIESSQAMARPVGTGYYAIEDLNVGMDLQQAFDKLRTGGYAPVPDGFNQPCLTLPEGVFEAPAFRWPVDNSGLPPTDRRYASNFTFLAEQVGLIGSGKGTIIRTTANSMTEIEYGRIPPEFQPDGSRTAPTELNKFHTIILNKVRTPSGQFSVHATSQRSGDQGYGGLRIQSSNGGTFSDMWVQGFPGYLNSPPGETYNFAIDNCQNVTCNRLHADGRDVVTGTRRSAIGFGVTNCTNWTAYDCTATNMGFSHGFVWWRCNGVTTYDAVATYNGSNQNNAAQYGKAGWGLNHEQTDNSKHYRPRLGWNTGGDVRYYSNRTTTPQTTGPHLLDSVIILDNTQLNVLIEKYQSWGGESGPQPGLTLVNCPTPNYSNNQLVP